MTVRAAALILALVLGSTAPAAGKPRGKARGTSPRRPPPAAAPDLPVPAPAAATPARATPEPRPPAKPPKVKVYTFTGLDVEGKLKTPQLLYFFDRVKLELDTTAQPRRSFLKELEATSSDKGL
jgi:hypothetical protein